jgi:hypothetical protein
MLRGGIAFPDIVKSLMKKRGTGQTTEDTEGEEAKSFLTL